MKIRVLLRAKYLDESFYRADKARSRSEDGRAGLGLAIALWITHAHDGDLQLAELRPQRHHFYRTPARSYT
ncbi:MAG TPA: hypothetical protein VIQ24_13235 [Pyrinomonadaceae bacterium]